MLRRDGKVISHEFVPVLSLLEAPDTFPFHPVQGKL
jgi:hypothetical protein